MKKHLFLTGPIGCGKSTAIANALGERLFQCSGFLTRRYRDPHLHFVLESPDGRLRETFLDFASGEPKVNLSAFSEDYLHGNVLILDEIGGIELLDPSFASALTAALASDIPILGVIKAGGSSDALIRKLGLTDTYKCAAEQLRELLRSDANTLVYECAQYDENALLLTKQWAEENLHE